MIVIYSTNQADDTRCR